MSSKGRNLQQLHAVISGHVGTLHPNVCSEDRNHGAPAPPVAPPPPPPRKLANRAERSLAGPEGAGPPAPADGGDVMPPPAPPDPSPPGPFPVPAPAPALGALAEGPPAPPIGPPAAAATLAGATAVAPAPTSAPVGADGTDAPISRCSSVITFLTSSSSSSSCNVRDTPNSQLRRQRVSKRKDCTTQARTRAQHHHTTQQRPVL